MKKFNAEPFYMTPMLHLVIVQGETKDVVLAEE
jgi:hypothetical protein